MAADEAVQKIDPVSELLIRREGGRLIGEG
jgi:hypothetical protein